MSASDSSGQSPPSPAVPSTAEVSKPRGPQPESAGGPAPRKGRAGGGALLVAAGIFLSRVVGVVGERVLGHYLRNAEGAGARREAERIPNFLQNLLGEGVLSASFIPVYARLEGRGEHEAARRVAGAVFGLLALASSVAVALGVVAAPWLVDAIAPGLVGGTRDLTVLLVRVLFPGVGLLVLSAWCLGILNSHRRFFLSYAAPVLWNLAIVATLLGLGGRRSPEALAHAVAWGAVAGCALQLLVQLPSTLRALGGLRVAIDVHSPGVRQVLASFGPVLVGRGVVQVSAFVDMFVASFISERAISTLGYAQTLYLLPVSLFGMAVSAAELPEMARAAGTGGAGVAVGPDSPLAATLRGRIDAGSRRIAFFVVPSSAAFLLLGDVVGAALFQTGRFGADDARYLWYLLGAATLGLLASATARLYSSSFYALQDTHTPLRFAVVRVVLAGLLGAALGIALPRALGLPADLGGALLLAAAGAAAWVEFGLLRRALGRRIGPTGLSRGHLLKLWGAAGVAGLVGLGVKAGLVHLRGAAPGALAEWGGTFLPAPALHPILTALAVLLPFGGVYFALTTALGLPEARAVVGKVLRRVRR